MVSSPNLLDLRLILKLLFESKTKKELYTVKKEVKKLVYSLLSKKALNQWDQSYNEQAFFVYGQYYVKKGFTLHDALIAAIKDDLPTKYGALDDMYSYLSNKSKKLSENQKEEYLHHITENNCSAADSISKLLNVKSDFFIQMRLQSYFKTYAMLKIASRNRTRGFQKKILDCLKEYIHGVYTVMKYSGKYNLPPQKAWLRFSRNIKTILEYECFLLKNIPQFSSMLLFALTLEKRNQDKQIRPQDLYWYRLQEYLILMLKEKKDPSEIAELLLNYIRITKITQKSITLEGLTVEIEKIISDVEWYGAQKFLVKKLVSTLQ